MPSIGDLLLLKRSDLLNFPKETVDIILEMQDDGWRGQRNNQGHVKMLAPDGITHAMATSNRNSPMYLRSKYRQYKKKNGQDEKEEKVKVSQKWPCARPNCPKVYNSEEALNTHITVDHEKQLICEYTDCQEVRSNKQKLSLHMAAAHGYVSPNKAKRLAAKKRREERDAVKAQIEEVVENANSVKEDVDTIVFREEPFGNQLAAIVTPDEEITIADSQALSLDKSFGDQLSTIVDPDEGITNSKNSLLSAPKTFPIFDDSVVGRVDIVPPATLTTAKNDESWTLDLTDLKNYTINDLETILGATGLVFEIRARRK